MTISPPPTSPNNVEDQSPVSKPNFNIVQGGRGARQEYFSNDANGTPFKQSVPRLMAIVVVKFLIPYKGTTVEKSISQRT